MNIHYKTGDSDIRPWGTWEVLISSENFVIKKIVVLSQKILSLQLHHHRSEHWIILQGTGIVTLDGTTFTVQQNDHIFIPKKHKHRIENDTNTPLIFIEIQTGDILDENDIVRFQDEYGRV